MGVIVRALPLILVPLVVLGGMYNGMFTATEAGAIGSMMAFILGIAYKQLTLRMFYDIFIDAVSVTAMVMLLICASYVLSYVMSFTGMTQVFIDLLLAITRYGSIWGLLFLLAILLILGCFIDLIVLCIVLAPTAVGAMTPLGVNPYHVCAVFLIGNLIAIITPPVGVSLFTATMVLNEKIERVSRQIIPFVIMYIVITLLVIFFPGSVLCLPHVLGMDVGW